MAQTALPHFAELPLIWERAKPANQDHPLPRGRGWGMGIITFMTTEFTTIGLVGRFQTREVGESLGAMAAFLRTQGVSVLIDESTAASTDIQGYEVVSTEALGARTMPLKHLQDAVLRKIDAADASFWLARNASSGEGPRLGLLERQRLRVWLAQVESDLARLGV